MWDADTISFNAAPSFFDCEVPVVRMSLNMPALDGVKEVAVLATPATIATHRHKHLIHEDISMDSGCMKLGFPGLAHAIEMGESRESMESIVRRKMYGKAGTESGICLFGMYTLPTGKRTDCQISPHAVFWDPAEITVEERHEPAEIGPSAGGNTAAGSVLFYRHRAARPILLLKVFLAVRHMLKRWTLENNL